MTTNKRNIAIIAHVDHGKTTLVDALLHQSGAFRSNQAVNERAMDKNDIERERGITILAKCTSIKWHQFHINIVDTPGHADFGAEVERILNMVDGVLVLVDAAEGPMPQTKFVTQKALRLGLKPIVVLNKADKPDARPDEVHEEVFDLFASLGATEEQLDFPMLYASAKEGWAINDIDEERKNLDPLYKMITTHVAAPTVKPDQPFRMLTSLIMPDAYLGKLLIGKIYDGKISTGDQVQALMLDGSVRLKGRISKVLAFRGLDMVPVDSAEAGDIVALAGIPDATVADTVASLMATNPLPAQPIDPPTLSVTISINDSPLAGREGDKVTSRMIYDRLMNEADSNVALKITQSADKDSFEVAGRGELQLGVLIETMRREGFELTVSRPRIIYQEGENGEKLEPIEEITVDVDDEFTGIVVEKLSARKGEMIDMRPSSGNKTRMLFHIPSRGLIGYHREFLSDTRGTGLLNRIFLNYQPMKGPIEQRRNGVLVSNGEGESVAYALFNIEERGFLFIDAGEKIYEGMIIGENAKDNDLDVNALKGKQLTNHRASGKDEAVKLTTPRRMSLERAISYIKDDELVEVTPKSIRLRKRFLDPIVRKRESRKSDS